MASVKSMMARTAKLEFQHVPPILAKFGGPEGWAAFEANATAGIADGRYDSRDIPVVVEALRSWLGSV